ncbi:MAG TPA: SIMPL domain-containing protein [Firmicutes bacterium]|nr:SIMPL domain-containing protein [Bacillota bacterium]
MTRLSAVICALVVGVALIICALIISKPAMEFVTAKKSITVTGSAKKQIRSDLIVWRSGFSRQSDDLGKAYAALKADLAVVKNYLVQRGIKENEIVFQPVSTETIYATDPKTGMMTRQIAGYVLYQNLEVRSAEVDKIAEISRSSTELIEKGIVFHSYPPQYYYTKLNELKVDMLAEAAKDAMARAEKIAAATGSRVGHLRAAKMGVFQITPKDSTEVSDYGINDTSSLEKDITAVVNAEFAVQ